MNAFLPTRLPVGRPPGPSQAPHHLALCELMLDVQAHLMTAQRQLEDLARTFLDGHELRKLLDRRAGNQRISSRQVDNLDTLGRINELYQVGLSVKQIAKMLNQEGRPAPGERQWGIVSVRRALDRIELDPPARTSNLVAVPWPPVSRGARP